MNLNKGIFLLSLFFLAGCQTLPMPEGPSVAEKPFLPNAPIAGIHVNEKRTSENIGSIGLAFIKVKKDQSIAMAGNYLSDMLYEKGLNTVMMPSVNFGDKASLTQAASQMNAKLLVQLTVVEYSVTSIDLILDKPSYETTLIADVYDASGNLLLNQTLKGSIESRAVSATGSGKAVAEALEKALDYLGADNAFQKEIEAVKDAAPSNA